jgi:endonuclease V-like protein UPF0215 family
LPLHVHKKGIRILGIAESFMKGTSKYSILSGVVMRADMTIDGFTFSKATVGGMDATEKIIEMFGFLDREDISVILLNGCIISWYNVVNLNQLADAIELPLICVTYKESEGLEAYFKKNFLEDWQERTEIYHQNGSRIPLTLKTGHTVYTRFLNINKEETLSLLNKLTIHGAIPEPLRIARILARSVMKSKKVMFH